MTSVPVTFHKIIQAVQEYATGDEYMLSRIFFRVQAKGQIYEGWADLKQLVGSNFETPGSIEVGTPKEYLGPKLNHIQFADAAAKYYKSQVGSSGRGIYISGGASVKMKNNLFQCDFPCHIEVEEAKPPSW